MKKSNDFLPSHVVKTRHQDGTTSTSEIYTTEAYGNRQFGTFIFILFVAAFMVPFAGLLCVLFYVLWTNGNSKLFPICGSLITLYLLYDIKHSWILSSLYSAMAHPIEKVVILRGTMCMSLANLILLGFGNRIHALSNNNKLVLFIYVLIISLVCYFVGTYFLIDHFKLKLE
jgi:hypothetical protein